jgi:hypothetical protein
LASNGKMSRVAGTHYRVPAPAPILLTAVPGVLACGAVLLIRTKHI